VRTAWRRPLAGYLKGNETAILSTLAGLITGIVSTEKVQLPKPTGRIPG